MENKWYACFEMDTGSQICRDLLNSYGSTSTSCAVYAVLTKDGERIPCGQKELCWWDGEWEHTHYRWVKSGSSYNPDELEPEEIEITDRQIRNEYALAAEELREDVIETAKEHGISLEDIEWEENPYDDDDPDDFYFCEWDDEEENED